MLLANRPSPAGDSHSRNGRSVLGPVSAWQVIYTSKSFSASGPGISAVNVVGADTARPLAIRVTARIAMADTRSGKRRSTVPP